MAKLHVWGRQYQMKIMITKLLRTVWIPEIPSIIYLECVFTFDAKIRKYWQVWNYSFVMWSATFFFILGEEHNLRVVRRMYGSEGRVVTRNWVNKSMIRDIGELRLSSQDGWDGWGTQNAKEVWDISTKFLMGKPEGNRLCGRHRHKWEVHD
jgi:hypothetical protein